MSLLIQGGRVVDPASGTDAAQDVYVADGRIARVGPALKAPAGATVMDARGKIVCPGYIDIHVHLREPGYEYKETVATGTRAAAAGGFTAVCCMANTFPVNDNRAVTDYILARARVEGVVRVQRRAYRSRDPVDITEDLIEDFTGCAQLSASCNNNQPWRFIFVYEQDMLKKMLAVFSKGNAWVENASMYIAVLSKKDYDCIIDNRVYHHFDTGMATAYLILRATELGLVAHPIAGYSPQKTREILGIPDDIEVITLVIVGKHSKTINPILSKKQIASEQRRPERFPFEKFVYLNQYSNK